MDHSIQGLAQNQFQIATIEETSDTLTSRAGLALFARHFDAMK